MKPDPKRDAEKAEEAGLTAEPMTSASVAKPDAPGEAEGEAKAAEPKKDLPKEPVRPRQDSLDLQRAAGEGMTAPPASSP